MKKKYWNYTYSVLLSIILVLLVGIFIHLSGGNSKIYPLLNEEAKMPEEKARIREQEFQDEQVPFLYEIFQKSEDELQLFHQFTQGKLDQAEGLKDSPKIAIIIDDLGYQKEIAERIISLDFPVTISILPFLPHSQIVAQMAKEKGLTVLLHLPMEPQNSNVNPGQGAIFSTMTEEEIRNKMLANFQEVPYVDGINNHMGSKATENTAVMRIVLNEVRERGLFFIDSMTSPNSVGYTLSKQMGIKTAYRSVFLDNDQDIDYIRSQVNLLKDFAEKYGTAIAIGHPYCNTIDVLSEIDLLLRAEGIRIVKLEELLE